MMGVGKLTGIISVKIYLHHKAPINSTSPASVILFLNGVVTD